MQHSSRSLVLMTKLKLWLSGTLRKIKDNQRVLETVYRTKESCPYYHIELYKDNCLIYRDKGSNVITRMEVRDNGELTVEKLPA